MMKPLGLVYQKINICPNLYMLYYLKNKDLIECKICGHARYKTRPMKLFIETHMQNDDH